jgi:hypothetical protein
MKGIVKRCSKESLSILNDGDKFNLIKTEEFNELMDSISNSWIDYQRETLGNSPNVLFVPCKLKSRIERIINDNTVDGNCPVNKIMECEVVYLEGISGFSFGKLFLDE